MNKILGVLFFIVVGSVLMVNVSLKPLQGGDTVMTENVCNLLMTVISLLFALGLIAVALHTKNALGRLACFILGGIFASPALAIVLGFAGSSIGAAITSFFAGFGKVIMTVLGIVIAYGVATYLNNRRNR